MVVPLASDGTVALGTSLGAANLTATVIGYAPGSGTVRGCGTGPGAGTRHDRATEQAPLGLGQVRQALGDDPLEGPEDAWAGQRSPAIASRH